MKYYVVQDINCFYTTAEEDFHGYNDDVVAVCGELKMAKLIAGLLAEHFKE